MELSARLISQGHTCRAVSILSRAFELHPDAEQVVIVLLDLLADTPDEATRVFDTYSSYQKKVTSIPDEQVVARLNAINFAAEAANTKSITPSVRYEAVHRETDKFIGRGLDLERVLYRLATSFVVAVTGPIGVGKSRLAAEICALRSRTFANGVVIVELGNLGDAAVADDILTAIMGHLEMAMSQDSSSVRDAVFSHLRRMHLLMVLEHANLCSAAAFTVAVELHSRCPLLSIILTTPIEPDSTSIDTVRISPLSTRDSAELAHVLESDAAKLLFSSLADRDEMAVLGQPVRTQLANLIQETGGLPLSIKLITGACGGHFDNLIAQLDTPILQKDTSELIHDHYLAPLSGHLDWTVSQLSVPERAALYRLSIFRGGFSLDAAATILADHHMPPQTSRIFSPAFGLGQF